MRDKILSSQDLWLQARIREALAGNPAGIPAHLVFNELRERHKQALQNGKIRKTRKIGAGRKKPKPAST